MLDFELPDFDSWASLLGLLHWSEYFVTVDHSSLWQKHASWAKPRGEKLQAYVTQRLASNMVVLSLMLATQMNVFFNSSHETATMRIMLGTENYGDLKYWIGILILLDACVTVMAIVTSVTAWSMISALSDTNTHALLRSSIGLYVISLPSRFVVAALYLFMTWLTLFFVDLINGPMRFVLVAIVLTLFFQIIVPLSAFGRLVIHTGAMARRRVLDEQFEKELLPSGLHASLLIRATNRRMKYSSAVQQYQKSNQKSASTRTARSSMRSAVTQNSPEQQDIPRSVTTQGRNFSEGLDPLPPIRDRAQTSDTAHSGEFMYPEASVLNSASPLNLKIVVEEALRSGDISEMPSGSFESDIDEHLPPQSILGGSKTKAVKHATFALPSSDENCDEMPAKKSDRRAQFASLRQAPENNSNPLLNMRSQRIQEEWKVDEEVRGMYDEAPPAEIMPGEDVVQQNMPYFPRASFMNKARGLASLRKLVTKQDLGTPDSSVGDDDPNESNGDIGAFSDDEEQPNEAKKLTASQLNGGDQNRNDENDRLLPRGRWTAKKYTS